MSVPARKRSQPTAERASSLARALAGDVIDLADDDDDLLQISENLKINPVPHMSMDGHVEEPPKKKKKHKKHKRKKHKSGTDENEVDVMAEFMNSIKNKNLQRNQQVESLLQRSFSDNTEETPADSGDPDEDDMQIVNQNPLKDQDKAFSGVQLSVTETCGEPSLAAAGSADSAVPQSLVDEDIEILNRTESGNSARSSIRLKRQRSSMASSADVVVLDDEDDDEEQEQEVDSIERRKSLADSLVDQYAQVSAAEVRSHLRRIAPDRAISGLRSAIAQSKRVAVQPDPDVEMELPNPVARPAPSPAPPPPAATSAGAKVITVKVRYLHPTNNEERSLKMKLSEDSPFQVISDHFMKKIAPPGFKGSVSMEFDGESLGMQQTPKTHDMETDDIIELRFKRSERPDAKSTVLQKGASANAIIVKVRYVHPSTGQETLLKMKLLPNSCFDVIHSHFKTRIAPPGFKGTIVLEFDGEALALSDTPQTYDMESDDIIDLRFK